MERQGDWQALVDSFGLHMLGTDPWDAELLEGNFEGASHGERCVIQFLLNVRDPSGKWRCGSFDVLEALTVCDATRHAAFLRWATEPRFP